MADARWSLFPCYPELPGWYAREVEGLTDAQLDFDDDGVEWMKWSIRRQVSHAAFAHFSWLLRHWTPQVFRPGDPLPEVDLEAAARYDRRFDEETDWSMDRLLKRMREAVDMVGLVLGRESPASMREKFVERVIQPGERYASGDSALEFWTAASGINDDISGDLRVRDDEPHRFRINLAGMFRQLYFEGLLHLHTVQRLKRAQGLRPVVSVPREGYLRLPAFSGEAG